MSVESSCRSSIDTCPIDGCSSGAMGASSDVASADGTSTGGESFTAGASCCTSSDPNAVSESAGPASVAAGAGASEDTSSGLAPGTATGADTGASASAGAGASTGADTGASSGAGMGTSAGAWAGASRNMTPAPLQALRRSWHRGISTDTPPEAFPDSSATASPQGGCVRHIGAARGVTSDHGTCWRWGRAGGQLEPAPVRPKGAWGSASVTHLLALLAATLPPWTL